MKYKVEPVLPADETETLQVLTLALVNDPGIVYFSPDAAKRVKHTLRMIQGMSGLLNAFGQKYLIRDKGKIVGSAMWVPPGKSINNWRLMKAGFFLIPFITGLSVFKRIMKFLDIATLLQEKNMKNQKHWHLVYLGVHPANQRRGLGKTLLSGILHESDKTQIPVFVQVFTSMAEKFLLKNGFQVVSRTRFSEHCIMNCMVRYPKPAKTMKKITKKKKPVAKKKKK